MTEPIARIEAALARLGAEHEPPAGWEARVLAAAVPQRRSRWWFALPVFAAAGLALAIVYWTLPMTSTDKLELALSVRRGTTLMRGVSMWEVDDVVHASATGGAGHRAIWVYRKEQLLLVCPGAPACRTAGGELTAEVTLRQAGAYTIVAVTSSAPIAAPTGTYDTDVAGAQRAGEIKSEALTVQ